MHVYADGERRKWRRRLGLGYVKFKQNNIQLTYLIVFRIGCIRYGSMWRKSIEYMRYLREEATSDALSVEIVIIVDNGK